MNKFIGSLNTILFGVVMLIGGLFYGFLLCIDSPALLTRINYLGYTKPLALFSYAQLFIFSILYMISGNGLIYARSWSRRFTFNLALASLFVNAAIFLFLFFRLKGSIFEIDTNSFMIRINFFHMLGGIIYPIFLLIILKSQINRK